jgi:hypothetical protein
VSWSLLWKQSSNSVCNKGVVFPARNQLTHSAVTANTLRHLMHSGIYSARPGTLRLIIAPPAPRLALRWAFVSARVVCREPVPTPLLSWSSTTI